MPEMVQVIKIGGAVINDDNELVHFLEDFVSLRDPKILVHGGGRAATELSQALGIETQMVEGRRVTDKETLGVAVMVYAGLINKTLVAQLQALGCRAVGLTGADGDVIRAVKRPVTEIDFGFVGDIDRVDIDGLTEFFASGLTPVIAPITHDGQGQLLNTNADTIASHIAQSLCDTHDVHLRLCFEKPGVLADPDDEESVIEWLTQLDFVEMLKDKQIHSGMIPKLQNAFAARVAGVQRVEICSHRDLVDPDFGGTLIEL